MAQILVGELPDAVVERLKARAKRNGRSLEAEVREILRQRCQATEGFSSARSDAGRSAGGTTRKRWSCCARIAIGEAGGRRQRRHAVLRARALQRLAATGWSRRPLLAPELLALECAASVEEARGAARSRASRTRRSPTSYARSRRRGATSAALLGSACA